MSTDSKSMSADELEPCPFCGPGNSIVECWEDDYGRHRVSCGACGSSTGIHPRDKTPAPAIASWNRRPRYAVALSRLAAAEQRIGELEDLARTVRARVRLGVWKDTTLLSPDQPYPTLTEWLESVIDHRHAPSTPDSLSPERPQ